MYNGPDPMNASKTTMGGAPDGNTRTQWRTRKGEENREDVDEKDDDVTMGRY